VKARDQAAWERLVALYTPLIYAWCRHAGLQAADAADIGQDVFRAVARKVGDFRRERPGDSFRGWLRTITRNRILDHFSALAAHAQPDGGTEANLRLQQVADEIETDASVTNVSDESETKLLFRRAVELIRGEFEERSWQAFWRVVVEDQAPDMVAESLGLSRNSVYLAKSRILRRLRTEFADLVEK
jgi:RNA polymerase sigma-70 factor (ECF subfamily)